MNYNIFLLEHQEGRSEIRDTVDRPNDRIYRKQSTEEVDTGTRSA
jgi:hypothetical protein